MIINPAPVENRGQPPAGRFTCASYLDMIRRSADYFSTFSRTGVVVPVYTENDLNVTVERGPLPPAVLQRYAAERPTAAVDALCLWLRGDIAAKGPKVFRPTTEQCLAMEQITPRIPLADYAQAYPVMIVEPPEDYRRRRTCLTATRVNFGAHRMAAIPPRFRARALPDRARGATRRNQPPQAADP